MTSPPLEPGVRRRLHPLAQFAWSTLRELVGPALSAPALAVALGLAFSLVSWWALQFLFGFYDTRSGLDCFHGLLNAGLAAALAVLMLLRPTWHRAHAVMLSVSACVLVGALGGVWARLDYRHGLQGDAFYALPHQTYPYDEDAQRVTFATSDGVGLVGTLLARNHRTRGVVYYPCWRTDRTSFAVVTLAQWLANGVDVLVVDPRGQGESGGAKTPDGADKNDIMAAVAYLHATGHAHVGVLSEEDGAPAAIQAATMHEGIDSVALIAPEVSWGESLGQQGHLYDPHGFFGRLYWRIAAGLRLAAGEPAPAVTEAVRFVAPTPLLLAACKTDPGSAIDLLHLAAGEPKSLIVLGGTGRPADWAHFAEYYQTVEQWFDMTLRKDAAVEPAASP